MCMAPAYGAIMYYFYTYIQLQCGRLAREKKDTSDRRPRAAAGGSRLSAERGAPMQPPPMQLPENLSGAAAAAAEAARQARAAQLSEPASMPAAAAEPPESLQQRNPEPEPEPEPLHVDGSEVAASSIASLYAGYPSAVIDDPRMGGCRGVVATRDIALGERVLAAAPMGVSVDWRHKATGCAHCFATREADDPEGDEWELYCETCRSCYYCSAECMASAAPKHALECGALCAVERRKQLKNPERSMGRLLISMLATLRLPCVGGRAPLPTLDHLLELFPDQPEKEGAKQRAKQRIAAAKFVLADAGDELLAALPPGSTKNRQALLVSALARCPMNIFGLWATADGEDGMAGSGCYPAAAMFNHSCMPNVAHQFERRELAFYAVRPIEAGEALSFCYIPLDRSASRRQKALDAWCFKCRCSRCKPGAEGRAAAAALDAAYLCACGQFKIARGCLRPGGPTGAAQGDIITTAGLGSSSGVGSGSVDALTERWAEAQGVSSDIVCCCGIYNLMPATHPSYSSTTADLIDA
jgi:hypothetical protein